MAADKPDKPRIPTRKDDLRRLRAKTLLSLKIRGRSYAQMADELGITKRMVARDMSWARREGLIKEAEEEVLGDLVPLALKAFKAALENGDTSVAKEVLLGAGILKKTRVQQALPPGEEEMTLELYARRRRKSEEMRETGAAAAITAGGDGDSGERPAPEIVEAEVLPSRGGDNLPGNPQPPGAGEA